MTDLDPYSDTFFSQEQIVDIKDIAILIQNEVIKASVPSDLINEIREFTKQFIHACDKALTQKLTLLAIGD
ncbi:hypothetical protein [Longirhabdus pacifica]|uniref:hypothetical protein n=1 Tax=Longirhabdus pacifica TaxID=2305227 RepID=UPI0010087ED1|nr:hypothetical protein [Longirhabdus pacifica]